jgi:signal transduction histidine kinase/DNA-binding response OmpR family regulator
VDAADFVPSGGGACGDLVRSTDWSRTPIGPVEAWSRSLRFGLETVLSSRYPMLLLWGEQFTQLYNDAYAELIGDKHPAAMGDDVRVTLAEGWDVLGPLIAEAMRTGVASWVPALQLLLERSGYREEAYFSVSHAPARDDDGRTVGVLTVCSEVTDQVVSERRLRILRDLSLGSGRTLDVQSCVDELRAALRDQLLDVPLAAVYLRAGDQLELALAVGQDAAGSPVDDLLPAQARVGGADEWGLGEAGAGAGSTRAVADGVRVPGGPWGDLVGTVVVQPLPSSEVDVPLGVLVLAVSPNRALDEGYASFLSVVGQQVAAALRKARAFEDERRRAEALAELDRAKTEFFTNVSHEFRTPLTLMLGPLADALQDASAPLPPVQRDRLETAHRNAERLQRLVEDLLSFSTLQAGRGSVAARVVDLPAATVEHASAFRAAVERADLELVVDCPPLPQPVSLDPQHWETIVTNLLSNALKFTFVGSIRVSLRADAGAVVLEVADTGIGIAEHDRRQLFERFARVHGVRARSHEGSGIGLALVAELTRLHGGDVSVDSVVGSGTTFRVRLPWSAIGARAGDLPTGPATSGRAHGVAAEAARWTDADPQPRARKGSSPDAELVGARVLVADDNRDMRHYLVRLLEGAGCHVTAVGDGAAALRALQQSPPDLLLTDVMMPELDGFELLQAVRRDDALGTLPVVVLSARAGGEASVEGLDLGADDYVTKPFRGDELVARVRSVLRLARLRSAHVRQLTAVAETTAVLASGRDLDDALQEVVEQARALVGATLVRVRLEGRSGRPGVEVASPAAAAAPGAPPELVLPVEADGAPAGVVEVWGEVDALRRSLLAPVATAISALTTHAGHADRDREVAVMLQRSLLPQRLPDVPGLELAATYLPASEDLQVGGDWYDVLALPGGRVLLTVGDAAGHGLAAATAMGQLRDAVRPTPCRTPTRGAC